MSRLDVEYDQPVKREDVLGCKVARLEIDAMTSVAQATCLRLDKDAVVDSFAAQDVVLTAGDVAAIVGVVVKRAIEQGKVPAGKTALSEAVAEPVVEPILEPVVAERDP